MERRVVKPPGQDLVVERLKSRYGLAGSCCVEVRRVEPAACSAGRAAAGGLRPAFLGEARPERLASGKPPRCTGHGFGPLAVTRVPQV